MLLPLPFAPLQVFPFAHTCSSHLFVPRPTFRRGGAFRDCAPYSSCFGLSRSSEWRVRLLGSAAPRDVLRHAYPFAPSAPFRYFLPDLFTRFFYRLLSVIMALGDVLPVLG